MNRRILCLGDAHLPHLNKALFTRIIDEVVPSFKPHIIIQMGDLYDLYAWSRFPKKQTDPQDEITEAFAVAGEMWEQLHRKRKSAKLIQITGNHDLTRVKKLVDSKAPELRPFISMKDFWTFPKVESHLDPKEPLIIGDLLFTHGHRTRLQPHLKDFSYQYNVIIGHLHRAHTHWERVGPLGKVLFAHCCGWIGNAYASELNYRPQNKFYDWTNGVTLIEQNSPRFIPL